VIAGGLEVAVLGACCAFHASGSNAPWLGGESSGQPPLKAALRPVRCGDSRLIPTSCNPGVSSRMGASVAELLRCRVSGLFFCDMCAERRRRADGESARVRPGTGGRSGLSPFIPSYLRVLCN
jgi:hypothetical protein